MPSVRPEIVHAHPVRKPCSVARPRTAVPSSGDRRSVVEMIADLLKGREPPDANELRCFDLIRRFHRWGRRDSCYGLRLVTVPVVQIEGTFCLATDSELPRRRCVWELACFRYATGSAWHLVTWGINEEVILFQPFDSESAARAAFRRIPEPVRNPA